MYTCTVPTTYLPIEVYARLEQGLLVAGCMSLAPLQEIGALGGGTSQTRAAP